MIKPRRIRLDTSTACQLRCPTCPTADGRVGAALGTGLLRFADFRAIVDANPWVRSIELSNWGEIFLNPELLAIMEYACAKDVALTAQNGVNFNRVPDEVLEGLVRCRFRSLRCSIDGASPETYRIYRRRGDFDAVIANLRRLNELKRERGSALPHLIWQFVVFGHNEHEIAAARTLASELGMDFQPKLAWGDLYASEAFSPVRDRDLVRRELGAADRAEYAEQHGFGYERGLCRQLWSEPQVNVDGRVLGCCVNYWQSFGNAFEDGLLAVLNGERMRYARRMLQGRAAPRDDIPCTTCSVYHGMQRDARWFRQGEIPELPTALQRAGRAGRRLLRRPRPIGRPPYERIASSDSSQTSSASSSSAAPTESGTSTRMQFP